MPIPGPLERLRTEIARHSDGSSPVKYHLRKAISSHATPMELFRTVEGYKEAVDFATHRPSPYEVAKNETPALNASNCHNGQRKLAVALVEFVSDALASSSAFSATLVYVGASAAASAAVSKLFPRLRIIMFDYAPDLVECRNNNNINGGSRDCLMTRASSGPEDKVAVTVIRNVRDRESGLRTAIENDTRLVACTGKAGWFDDGVAALLRRLLLASPKNPLLFVSDIRKDNSDEVIITEDMIDQRRWVEMIGCSHFMLKFRVPFEWPDAVLAAFESTEVGRIKYLAGTLYLQLYPPANSAELRLVGRPDARGAYATRFYDVFEIEDAMILFNQVYRSHALFGPDAVTYERAAEDAIMRAASEVTGMDLPRVVFEFNSVVPTVADNCALVTARKQWKKLHDETKDLVIACERAARRL